MHNSGDSFKEATILTRIKPIQGGDVMRDVCLFFLKDSVILSYINERGVLCFIEARTISDLIKFNNLILN